MSVSCDFCVMTSSVCHHVLPKPYTSHNVLFPWGTLWRMWILLWKRSFDWPTNIFAYTTTTVETVEIGKLLGFFHHILLSFFRYVVVFNNFRGRWLKLTCSAERPWKLTSCVESSARNRKGGFTFDGGCCKGRAQTLWWSIVEYSEQIREKLSRNSWSVFFPLQQRRTSRKVSDEYFFCQRSPESCLKEFR